MTNFILPGGSRPAAQIHLARTVCRRAERLVVRLARHPGGDVPAATDRLSQPAQRSPLRPGPGCQPSGQGRGHSLEGTLNRGLPQEACEWPRTAGLRDKVVLITGGRRVGSALARLLADRGANLAMTYHTSRETIEQTIAEVQARGTDGLAVAADLSDAGTGRARRSLGRRPIRPSRCPGQHGQCLPADSVRGRSCRGDFDQMIAANLAAPYHTAVAAAQADARPGGDRWDQGKDHQHRRLGEPSARTRTISPTSWPRGDWRR